MEILTSYRQEFMNTITFIIFIVGLIFTIIMTVYNSLYLSRFLHSSQKVGHNAPKHMHHLLRTSIAVPLFTAIFIFFLMLRFS